MVAFPVHPLAEGPAMHRVPRLAAVAVSAIAAAAILAVTAGGQTPSAAPADFTVTSTIRDRDSAFVNNPPRRQSPGDVFLASGRITGAKRGAFDFTCTLTSRRASLCSTRRRPSRRLDLPRGADRGRGAGPARRDRRRHRRLQRRDRDADLDDRLVARRGGDQRGRLRLRRVGGLRQRPARKARTSARTGRAPPG